MKWKSVRTSRRETSAQLLPDRGNRTSRSACETRSDPKIPDSEIPERKCLGRVYRSAVPCLHASGAWIINRNGLFGIVVINAVSTGLAVTEIAFHLRSEQPAEKGNWLPAFLILNISSRPRY